MELQTDSNGADDTRYAGRRRASRRMPWAWLASTVLLLWMLVPSALAANFDHTFSSAPAGVTTNTNYGAGTSSFQMTLGGQDFVFTAAPDAIAYDPWAGLLITNATDTWTIRRLNNGPFQLSALQFTGSYGPSYPAQVRVLRNGSDAAPIRTVYEYEPIILTYSSVTVDEIRITSTDLFLLSMNRIAGSVEDGAPTVTTLSPTSGPTAGGTAVNITGTNFVPGATTVRFGGNVAGNVVVSSATQLSATSPVGSAGATDVTVTTAGGTSIVGAASRFTYIAPPVASNFGYLTAAYNSGGNPVTTFSAASFATNSPTSFAVGSATTAQGGSVSITSAGLVSYTSPLGFRNANDSFTYTATNAGGTSNVATVTVSVGNPTITTSLTNAGTGQVGTALSNVAIDAQGGRAPYTCSTTPASGTLPTGVQLNANCSLSGTPGQSGSFTFTASITDNSNAPYTATSSSLTLNVAAALPVVTGITPTAGPNTGGTLITITGSNFTGVQEVTFGGVRALAYRVDSQTSMVAVSPSGTGTVDVRVTTAAGTSLTSTADQFTYLPRPTVTSVSPNAGPTAGGTVVVLTGTNMNGATSVTFGNTPAMNYVVNSSTQITATAPAGAAGTLNVRVVTQAGSNSPDVGNQYTYVRAPSVTALSSSSGPTAGGNTVIITGADLSSTTLVRFGAAPASFTINSDTQITATAPANAAGTLDVTVTNPGGTSPTSAADQYTYVAAPTVTSVSPNAGAPEGGNTVAISGTGFTAVTSVTVGGTPVLGYAVDSTTQIRAEVPAGTGTVDVRVTTAGGTSATGPGARYSYVAAPTVTGVSPNAGAPEGGNTVAISGTGFTAVTSVTVGGTPVLGYAVDSDTRIRAEVPAGTGTVDVRVTTAAGTSATGPGTRYSYVVAPTVTGVSPNAGAPEGGNTVAISGTGFTGATSVTVGGVPVLGYAVDSDTQIRAEVPAGSGTMDVRVTTAGGTSPTGPGARYTYVVAPVASNINVGPVAPYNDGRNPTLSFSVSSFATNNPTSYAVTSATTALGGSVSINNVGLVTYTAPIGVRAQNDSFSYTATNQGGTSNAATVTLGIRDPSLVVTLQGTGEALTELNGVSIAVAGGRAPYTCATTPTLGILPPGVQLNADCTLSGTPTQSGSFSFATNITDSSNTPYTAASGTLTLSVSNAPLPTVTAISPTSGPTSGGTVVVITGSNFSGVTSVSFGAAPATAFTYNSATQLTAIAPAGAAGVVDVTVTTNSGTSVATAADRFTYVATPSVTMLSPTAGPTSGGTTVVITGANLSGAVAVTFGGTAATGYTVNSNTQITATAPANAAGTLNVRVTTVGGTSATSVANQYTYVAAPVANSFTYGTLVAYNDGSATALSFSVAGQVQGVPTSYAVSSATTALGGSVSIDNNGQVSYTAPVGRRAVNDSFQYTATNAGGTSSPATVTLTLGNPTLAAGLTGAGAQGVALSGVAVNVSGGRAPYTCATTPVSGALPSGVQLNADCSLSGAPTQTGSFGFAVSITDSSTAAFTATSGTLTLSVDASAPGAPTIGTATASGNDAVTVTFTAPSSNGGAAITGYTVTSNPGGITATGLGSPLTVTGLGAGTSYTFTVTATNAAGTGVASASSNAAMPIPVLVANPVSATVAYGASATPITLSITGTPNSVTVVSAPTHGTAVVSGTGIQYTPTPGYAGADSFTYRASDAYSTSSPATVSIMVSSPTVSLTTTTLPQGSTSESYSQTLQASGGAAPYTFAVTAGALPAGVTLQSNGTLSGRATVAGTFNVTVTATDSSTGTGPFSGSRGYSLVVVAPTVVLDMPELPEAEGAQGYSQQLTASGGTAPYRFALRSGRLPPGLELSESGAVSGEPTEAGTFVFSVDVTDANGFGGYRQYSFVVESAEQAITAFVANPEAPVYSPGATFAVSANGGASGQPVVFASATPAVCTVQGSTVAMVTAGNCVLTANQAGDALYSAAAQARLEVMVAAATPVITWVNDLTKVYGEDAFDLPAPQSNSPGAFTFSSSNTAVATLNGRTVTLQGEGTTTITAIQAASAGYAAASVQVQLVVAARPDPTTDKDVVSSLQAQVDSTVRFAQVQQANIRDRLRQVRTGSNASSMNVVLAYAGGNGSQGLSVPVGNGLAEAPALPQGWGAWAAGTLSFGSSGRGRTSADFNTGGITIGADRAIGENVLFGIAGSWGRQDTEFDGSPSSTDADQQSLAVYGLWRTGEHLFVDAMLASGKLDFTMNRWSEAAAATAHSTRKGDQLFGSLTFGYEHRTTTGTTLTTYGRYDGHKAELDAYREQGLGVYDLSYGRQDVETSALALGLEGTHAFKTDRVTWRPHWNLEYRTALDDRSDVTMNYVQRPVARDYLLAMHSYNDDTLSIGAGVDLQFDSGWMFSLLIGHDQGRNTLRSNSIGFQVRYGGRSSGSTVRSRPTGSDRLGSADAQQGCGEMDPGCLYQQPGQSMQPMQTGAR